jgi:hypothetical protein
MEGPHAVTSNLLGNLQQYSVLVSFWWMFTPALGFARKRVSKLTKTKNLTPLTRPTSLEMLITGDYTNNRITGEMAILQQ